MKYLIKVEVLFFSQSHIFSPQILELLKDFPHPVSVDVLTFEDYGSGTQTKLNAVLLSASVTDTTVPFSSAEVLEFIQSLSPVGVTVENGMVYWDGETVLPSILCSLCIL